MENEREIDEVVKFHAIQGIIYRIQGSDFPFAYTWFNVDNLRDEGGGMAKNKETIIALMQREQEAYEKKTAMADVI